jgi:cytochrome P450
MLEFLDLIGWSNLWYWSIGLIAFLVGWGLLFPRPKISLDQLPPAPKMGFLEYLRQLLSSEGPQFALKIAREFGYISRMPGGSPLWIYVNEPTLARKILDDPRSLKPSYAYELFNKATGGGENFFPANGHRANHVRKSTAAAFSPQNIKFIGKVVEEAIEDWITNTLEPVYVQAKLPLDFDLEMMMVTADVIARAAMDYVLSREERTEMATTMRRVLTVFFLQRVNPVKNLFGFCYADIRQAQRDAVRMKKNLGHRFLEACRSNPNPNKNSVVYLISNDPEYANDDERASDVMLYFLAGFETTAHSIAWTILELARNPNEQTKLRAALKEHDAQITNDEEKPDFRLCPQLKNVTREALRLHAPAALGSVRIVAEDIAIPNTNQIIPKGAICSMILYVILRNHNIFQNPDSFDPSRWEKPTEQMQRAYLPFATGKRNCQGQALATFELSSVVARVVRAYKLEVVKEGAPYYMITLNLSGSQILVTRLEE